MKEYCSLKIAGLTGCRNAEETEERSEVVNAAYIDGENINTKNIHNKKKEYR